MATKPPENPKGPDLTKSTKGPPAAGKTQEQPPEVKTKEPPQPPVAGQKSPAEEEGALKKSVFGYLRNFKESNRDFWYMGHAQLKILTLGCLMTAYVKFSEVNLNPSITNVILMETSFLIFFIVIHVLAMNRYVTCILWPVFEILNNLTAIVFISGITVVAVEEGKPFSDTYLASVILLGAALFFTTIDTCLQYRFFNITYMRDNFLVAPKRLEQKPKK